MEQRHEIIHFSHRIPGKIFLHRLGSVPKHWHRSIEVLFVLSGTVNAVIDDKTYTLNQTDIIVINSLSTHELYSEGGEMLALQISLSKASPFDLYKDSYFDCCSAWDTSNERYDYLRHLLARLIKENSIEEDVLLSHSLLSLLLHELLTNFRIPQPENALIKQKSLKQLTQITDYINTHFKEALTLNKVAREFHFSQSYLSRFFKQHMNMTFSAYYNAIRLDHAVNEMLASSESISVIALNNGFSDARSMTALFKKKYHMRPSEYRLNHPSLIPSVKMRNEVNYLAVTTTASLSSLSDYLKEPKEHPKFTQASIKANLLDIGTISVKKSGVRLRHTWRSVCCVGSSRDLLYGDVQSMLQRLQNDMPFSYVKFHGLLSDDMMLYDELPNGEAVISFTLIDKVFDFLLGIGLKPLMQLSFMPSALASLPGKTNFYTKQNSSPPKDMGRWKYLIASLVRHCISRYTLDEVLTWPYCVWNEPDTTPEMFGFERKEDFFQLYKETYETVKSIDRRFRFGSPSLLFLPEDPLNWYHPFFEFCSQEGCPPDFVNIHYYDDDIELLNDSPNGGSILNKLTPDENSFSKYLDTLYENANHFGLDKTPFYMTEWNLTVNHRNLINDTCFKACYNTKNLLENYDRLESFGYWSLTDLLGELQPSNELFHGGLGMFTVNGIPKSHYHAFHLISKIGDVRLSSGKGWFLTKHSNNGTLALMLYNYSHYDSLFSSGELFNMTPTNRYTSFSNLKDLHVTLCLTGLPFSRCRLRETFINQQHGSSYDTWLWMGTPTLERREDIAYLYHHSQPGLHISEIETADGRLSLDRVLAPLEVRLVEIECVSHPSVSSAPSYSVRSAEIPLRT